MVAVLSRLQEWRQYFSRLQYSGGSCFLGNRLQKLCQLFSRFDSGCNNFLGYAFSKIADQVPFH